MFYDNNLSKIIILCGWSAILYQITIYHKRIDLDEGRWEIKGSGDEGSVVILGSGDQGML